ncbi:MAG: hypothetical protein J7M25_02245 [Deltaproteobacteria bacterium]|nr:hypothetical protein [Deltaproteobacteria bacterium]
MMHSPNWIGVTLYATVMVAGCSKTAAKKKKPPATKSTVESGADGYENPPSEPTLSQKLGSAGTMTQVVSILKPHMENTFNDFSKASGLLALWWMSHTPHLEDLDSLEKTSYKRVMKDPQAERGKRLCARTRVIEIHAMHGGKHTYFKGGLIRGYSQIYRFIAVGSTGDLVQRSHAKFCGVVMGTQSYSNSGGGTAHGIEMVGMFDLKENHVKN